MRGFILIFPSLSLSLFFRAYTCIELAQFVNGFSPAACGTVLSTTARLEMTDRGEGTKTKKQQPNAFYIRDSGAAGFDTGNALNVSGAATFVVVVRETDNNNNIIIVARGIVRYFIDSTTARRTSARVPG